MSGYGGVIPPLLGAWRDSAVCAQVDPEIFYPGETGGNPRLAKAICASCPVIADCRAYALKNDIRHGIWGGMTPQERGLALRRQAKAAAR